jgi:AcrR family transcriptional regulator
VDPANHISLRERKYARTKLALLDAALNRLVDRPFDAISVKELCDEALVSEATFFNYFPKKTDLLIYFIQLWSIDVAWHGVAASKGRGGLAAIEAHFARTAERARRRPRVMNEIIAFMARQREEFLFKPVSLAERLMAFPDWDNVAALPDDAFDSLFEPNIRAAIELGELPRRTDVGYTQVALQTIFFGVPLALGIERAADVGKTYKHLLALVWAGLRATP